MYHSSWLLTAALVGMSVVLLQPAVMAAKSPAEVKSIARGVTVEIRLQQDSSVGSGTVVAHQGDLYTVVTNRHVICGQGNRDRVPAGETYELGLVDGQKYRVKAGSVRLIGTDLDLAIVQFRSSHRYGVAKLSTASAVKVEDLVYTAGFPLKQPGFSFNQGKAMAVVDKRIIGDRGGYSMIYNAATLPGMSGGGVFDINGQLVAIHGQGDRYRENNIIDDKSLIDSKTGNNRGIPVRWLTQSLAGMGISLSSVGAASSLENRSLSDLQAAKQQMPVRADEYFIAGFNKDVEPGADVVAGRRAAIQELSKAIELNPRYAYAYSIRAYVYAQLQEFQQSLNDLDRAIAFNPKYDKAYFNRAILKATKLNDTQGALNDYNQAITLNPKYDKAYGNRAILKEEKLNDIQSALNDYNQAIALNPKYDKAYYNRALMKAIKLNDVQGALSDYNQAIALNPKDALSHYNRGNLKQKKLNDMQGALSDYNQAIALDTKFALAYSGRGVLKVSKLNDKDGGIQDFRQAAHLFRAQGQTQSLHIVVDILQQLGTTE